MRELNVHAVPPVTSNSFLCHQLRTVEMLRTYLWGLWGYGYRFT